MKDLLKQRMSAAQQVSEMEIGNRAYESLIDPLPAAASTIRELPVDKLRPFFTTDIGFHPYSPEKLRAFAQQLLEQGHGAGIIEAVGDPLVQSDTQGDNLFQFLGAVSIVEHLHMLLAQNDEAGVGAPVHQMVIAALQADGAQVGKENGGVVVCFENCTGMKPLAEVDEENPDVYDALARKYLNIGCSCMSPNKNRLDLLDELIDDFQVDGVVDLVLQACHTYNVETALVKKLVKDKKGIPYTVVETDYSQADIEQINTRMAAFIEML